jgi:high-affinity nickel-transport protein
MVGSESEGNQNAIYLRLKNKGKQCHAKIPVLKRLPFPSIAIVSLLVVINLLVWIAVGIVLVSWS